jgi:hypothetical protein
LGGTARSGYHEFDSTTGGGERMTLGRIVRHLLGYYDELGSPPATNPDWVSHTNMVYHATENPDGWIRLDNVTLEPFDAATNPNGTMRLDRFVVKETTNLWATLQQIAKNEFFIIGFDKTDTLYYRRHPMFQTTLPDPRVEITESMIIGRPEVKELDTSDLTQVRLHAVTDEGDTLHSYYRDLAELTAQGERIDISYIRCNNQSTLDQWAYYRYYYETRDVELRLTLPGMCGLLFDVLDRVSVTYSGTSANGVHVSWSQKKFWIHDITVFPDGLGGGRTELVLQAENRP